MYSHHVYIAEYRSTGRGCQSYSWSAEQGKRIVPCLSLFAHDDLVSQNGFGLPVPRQQAYSSSTLRLNLVLTRGIPPDFRGGVHLFLPPYAIGSVLSLSGHAIAYRDSTGTGPVVLNMVPVTGVIFASPWTR